MNVMSRRREGGRREGDNEKNKRMNDRGEEDEEYDE